MTDLCSQYALAPRECETHSPEPVRVPPSPFWLGPRWPGDDGSCCCSYYGRGLSEQRVPSKECPVHA